MSTPLNADSGTVIEPTIHGYYRRQGYENCPKCGEWLASPNGSGGAPR
jgi:hypothetical protein